MPPFGSHPVPDLTHVRATLRSAFRAVVAAPPSLSSDRINYLVGETPSYAINNAPPGQPLDWTIQRDGEEPVSYADPSHRIDQLGQWIGQGGAWTRELAGYYTITAHVGDWSARTVFNVIEAFSRAPAKTAADLIGIAHVAGDYRFAGPGTPFGNTPFIVEGAQQMLNLGARRGHFYLSPQYKTSDYPFDDFGESPIRSLVSLADSPPFRMLFEQPFDQFVLTAYTFANWDWIVDGAADGRSVPFQAEAETAEFAELVSYFGREYPGRQFVLKNWEGDWQLQGSLDPDGVASPERVTEFVEWMRARQAGVVRGRAGNSQADVRHAIEFNLLQRAVRDEVSVLRDVVSEVDSDLISYSSWETSQRFDTRMMRDAIAFLKAMPANRGREVLISEFGHMNDPRDPAATREVNALLGAFVNEGVSAFFWQVFNNRVPYGLIGPGFERFDAWFALREALGVRNAAVIDLAVTSVPERIPVGAVLPIKTAFINTGRPWYQAAGYQLELLGPGAVDVGEVAWLPHDVPTSGQVTFEFDLRAAAIPGTYRLQMAERGIEVFGEPIAFEVIGASGPS